LSFTEAVELAHLFESYRTRLPAMLRARIDATLDGVPKEVITAAN
jgi:hypothetical protein